MNLKYILTFLILFSCVSTKRFNEEMLLLNNKVNTTSSRYLYHYESMLDSVYDNIELNRFLIEAIYGQLYELEAELIDILIRENSIYYVVKKGDCLWLIAQNELNDPLKWVWLADINNIENPDLIYPDQKLKIKE